jgi:hypothetical protein
MWTVAVVPLVVLTMPLCLQRLEAHWLDRAERIETATIDSPERERNLSGVVTGLNSPGRVSIAEGIR